MNRPAVPGHPAPAGDAFVPDKLLTAADLGAQEAEAAFKPALLDGRTGQPVLPEARQEQ